MKKLRLNLGCGSKLYPQEDFWINVDAIVPEKDCEIVERIGEHTPVTGKPLFHTSMLQKLNGIPDSCVDEIHAYHVIEHFFIDETYPLLNEWKRVLKPGGLIVLEQPDLLKCASNFLSGYFTGDQTMAFNLGVLGMYGAGTSKEPLMGHKTGWYPESLANQLLRNGYINPKVTNAQTHMKTIRDFRITAEKPYEE